MKGEENCPHYEKLRPITEAIDEKTTAMAGQIKRRCGRVKPGLFTKGFFTICRSIQKTGFNPKDKGYWEEKGWLGSKRPW